MSWRAREREREADYVVMYSLSRKGCLHGLQRAAGSTCVDVPPPFLLHIPLALSNTAEMVLPWTLQPLFSSSPCSSAFQRSSSPRRRHRWLIINQRAAAYKKRKWLQRTQNLIEPFALFRRPHSLARLQRCFMCVCVSGSFLLFLLGSPTENHIFWVGKGVGLPRSR